MRVLYISLFLLLCSVVFSCSIAQEGCTPFSEVRERADRVGWSVVQVTEQKAIVAYNALYNAHPPQSNENYSTVWLIILPKGLTKIVLGNQDEACTSIDVPASMIERLMQRALGEPI